VTSPMERPELRLPRHIGMVTCDLARAMETLGETFAVSWTEPTEMTQRLRSGDNTVEWSMRVARSTTGAMRVELLEGEPASTWHTTDLASLHHYAYTTGDLVADCDRLIEEGWQLELTGAHDSGGPYGFAYLVRPKRPRIELIQTDA
jgi:hypothetical protein